VKDFRCPRCRKLLARYRECGELQIKCPRCGYLTVHIDEHKKTSQYEEQIYISSGN
jgi:phage FluMu protein Com